MKFAMVGKFTQTDFPEAINCCPTRSKVVLMSIVSGNTYLQTHRIGLSVLRLTVVVFSTFSCCVVLSSTGLTSHYQVSFYVAESLHPQVPGRRQPAEPVAFSYRAPIIFLIRSLFLNAEVKEERTIRPFSVVITAVLRIDYLRHLVSFLLLSR
jgi:hypothetical protein